MKHLNSMFSEFKELHWTDKVMMIFFYGIIILFIYLLIFKTI